MNRIHALIALAGLAATNAPVANAAPKSGCTAAVSHQFDFWIGDWTVTNPKGKLAGHNRIESILGGCALAEHWQGARGSRGVSYNAYDAKEKVWRQFWVDADGEVLRLEGGLVDGKMVLASPPRGAHVDRITWTPNKDGSVRQFWQTSEDGGKTWAAAFDGLYRKTQ